MSNTTVARSFAKGLIAFLLLASLFGCQGSDEEAINDGSDDILSGGGATDINLQIGNGGGASFQGGVAEIELVSVDTLEAVWDINVVLADNNGLIVNDTYTISFSSTCASAALASFSESSVSTIAGRASTTYSSGTCTGTDTVIASLETSGTRLTATADLDIDSAIASAGGGGSLNTLTMGSGAGTAFTPSVLGASEVALQAGESAIISANIINSDGEPHTTSTNIAFSSDCVASGLSAFSEANTTVNGGLAQTVYTAQGCSGEDTVRARAEVNGQVLTANVTLDIASDTVLAVNFVSNSVSTLAIAGIGGQETALVTFRVVGAQGAPIVGEGVSFQLSNSIGGTRLASGTETGTTNNSGEVSTVVQSGTVNSSLRVTAIHDATGIQGLSNDISISTGVPVSNGFDLSLSPSNPNAWLINGAEVTITANASDQFGNPPPDGTRVSFRSPEIGTIDGSCELQDGACSVTWRSSGAREGNDSRLIPDTSGRGGRATVVAFMSGSETFVDYNANGFFDPDNANELASLVDLAETFVDENENGVFDSGENFVDSFLNSPAPTNSTAGGTNSSYDDSGDGIYNGPCSDQLRNDCPVNALQSTTISESVIISLSSPVINGEHPFCDGEEALDDIDNVIDTPFQFNDLVFCDTNGNSLPVGTTISFEANGLDIIGSPGYTVPSDTTEPTPEFNISVDSDDQATANPTFTIRIGVPGVSDVIYTWRVNEI